MTSAGSLPHESRSPRAALLHVDDEELTVAVAGAVGKDMSRRRLFLASIARTTFRRLAEFARGVPLLRVGYSVKTNPRRELLREALACGFYAECISRGEIDASLEAGFGREAIVYNGPVPAARLGLQPAIVFADSIQAYVDACRSLPDSLVGVRLRPPKIDSRFGVPPEQWKELAAAIRACGRPETAISFQVRSEDYGPYDFRGVADAVSRAAQGLEQESGVRVCVFDVGAGRSAEEFDASAMRGDYHAISEMSTARLPHTREILIEPGQELDSSVEALVAPIVEVRGGEIVFDAGLPDVPHIAGTPHRLFLAHQGRMQMLQSGPHRILGRTCLEDDVLGSVTLPGDVACGDAIVVADVGAYDASMQFAFAQGRLSGNTVP